MALTGGARAHDLQYGCESRSGPLKLGAGKGWRRHARAAAAVDAHMCDSSGTFGCERGWSPEMEATNE